MKSKLLLSLVLLASMKPLLCMDTAADGEDLHDSLITVLAKHENPNLALVGFLLDRTDVNFVENGTTPLLVAIDKKEEEQTAQHRRKLIGLLARQATPAHKSVALQHAFETQKWIALEALQAEGAQLSQAQMDSITANNKNTTQRVKEVAHLALHTVRQWGAGAAAFATNLIQTDDDSAFTDKQVISGYPPAVSTTYPVYPQSPLDTAHGDTAQESYRTAENMGDRPEYGASE